MLFSLAKCCLFFFDTIQKPRADNLTRAITPFTSPLHRLCDDPCRHLSTSTACQPPRRRFTAEARRNTNLWVTTSAWITATVDSSGTRQTLFFCLASCLSGLFDNQLLRLTTQWRVWRLWMRGGKKLHLSVALNYSFDLSALKYIVLWLIERYTFLYKYKSVL